MTNKRPFKLADLDAELEEVEFPDGSNHRVQRVTGYTIDVIRRLQAASAKGEDIDVEDLGDFWDLAQTLVPTATPKQIRSLGFAAVIAIMAIAQGNVRKVEDAAKNGGGLEELATLLQPAPTSPPTTSAPSSAPSPAPPDVTPAA